MEKGKIQAVRVHLDQLEVPPVNENVEKIVIGLEPTQPRRLVDHDPHLEGPCFHDLLFAAQKEKVRSEKVLEAYQAAYTRYQKDRPKLLDWIATNDRIEDQVIKTS